MKKKKKGKQKKTSRERNIFLQKKKKPTTREPISKGEIVKMVLMGIGLVGAVGAVIAFPGLAYLVPKPSRQRYSYNSVWKTVIRLDKRGWIEARQGLDGWKIRLTQKGWAEWKAYEFGQKHLDQQPEKWDKKWRMLMFDIPEKKKFLREKVRRMLRSFGFYRLQDSVWVFPHECREVLELLRTRYKIRSEALYALMDTVDNDRWLKEHFKLETSKK